ncbi:MAG: sigma-54-dependent Fis family transcriptional regulator, partial [Myxococcota bacterium]
EAGLAAIRSERPGAARLYLATAEELANDFPDLKPTADILRAELDLHKGGIERLSGMDRYLRALERALEAGDDLTVLEQARWLRRTLHAAGERSDPLAQQELNALTNRAWRRVALSLTPELRDDLARHLELPQEPTRTHDPNRLTYISSRLNPPGHMGAVPLALTPKADPNTHHKFYRMISLNRRILGETDLERLIPAALDIALDLSGAERGFLLLRQEKDGAFGVAFSRDIDGQPISEAHLEISQTVALEVATSGQAVVTSDAGHDRRFERAVSVVNLQLTSILCVPIRSRDRILGCLYLDHRSQLGVFEGEVPTMLAAYADQVAIALVSARRVSELRHERDELARAQAQIKALLAEKEALLMDLETRCETLEADLARERNAARLRYDYARIVGESPTMQRVLQQVDRVIATELPVVVQGESGTGKELISRAIHFNGPRREGPFVAVNCGALTESLLESELFGHKKGAFTGATADRKGLFESATGGTLFLDEVGEMSLVMQVKLLRALQEKRVRPVGATREVGVDVRILAATNRDLATMVQEEDFRQDLFYRLATLIIHLPPLRERPEDIPLLVRHILHDTCQEMGIKPPRVTGGAVQVLVNYTWPGNIRQLENIVRAALALSDGDITADVLHPLIDAQGPTRTAAEPRTISSSRQPMMAGIQVGRPPKCTAEKVREALKRNNYDRSETAQELKVSLRTLQRYMKKYRIQR